MHPKTLRTWIILLSIVAVFTAVQPPRQGFVEDILGRFITSTMVTGIILLVVAGLLMMLPGAQLMGLITGGIGVLLLLSGGTALSGPLMAWVKQYWYVIAAGLGLLLWLRRPKQVTIIHGGPP